MALIYEWGFFVIADREDDFRQWLAAHEVDLAAHSPRNLEYLGTYLPVWTTGETCDYYQLWRWGKGFGTDLRSMVDAEGGAFADLAREFLSFVDESRSPDETFRLHRSVTTSPPPD